MSKRQAILFALAMGLMVVAIASSFGCTAIGEAAGWTTHVVDPGSGEDAYYSTCGVCTAVMRADGKTAYYCPRGIARPAAAEGFVAPIPPTPRLP